LLHDTACDDENGTKVKDKNWQCTAVVCVALYSNSTYYAMFCVKRKNLTNPESGKWLLRDQKESPGYVFAILYFLGSKGMIWYLKKTTLLTYPEKNMLFVRKY
jgi:hypothetical protein